MIVTAQTSKLKGVANVIMLFNHGDLYLLYSFFKGRRSHQKNSKQDHTVTLTPISAAALWRGNMRVQLPEMDLQIQPHPCECLYPHAYISWWPQDQSTQQKPEFSFIWQSLSNKYSFSIFLFCSWEYWGSRGWLNVCYYIEILIFYKKKWSVLSSIFLERTKGWLKITYKNN